MRVHSPTAVFFITVVLVSSWGWVLAGVGECERAKGQVVSLQEHWFPSYCIHDFFIAKKIK